MKAVLQAIRILVVILLIEETCCQDGYSDQDILRLQQMATNEGQIEAITSYSTNTMQRDPNSQSLSSVNVQYQMTDDADKNDENNRSGRSRIKKVYRIKNPFQRQPDEDDRSQDVKSISVDNGTGASNQYAAMQYSLPPEEFLQQMRAENQYHQQQQQQPQQQQQLSTQSSSVGYTATPQPQYQYSTISTSNYDFSNQQSNQISQLEPKSLSQVYHSNTNNYQYNSPNSFGLDIMQSTPSPISQFLSTPLPNNQYLATPSNTFVSSSSPMYLSSPPSLQQYVSSPLSNIQTGSTDFGNRVTTTIGSNSLSYENNDFSKKMQIDHYDNSANGIRYPVHQQFHNEFPSTTLTPSSPYPEISRDSWKNNLSSGLNSKSAQEFLQAQYQNLRYNNNNNNQQDSRQESSYDNVNSDTHRIGSLPSANNVYLNFVQPDFQLLNSLKSRAREYEQETSQPEFYSHGDYGWKLTGKKSFEAQEGPTQTNYPRYQIQQADNNPVSQMNFHLDTAKPYNYDQTSKSSSEKLDAQEFAKAAAKAHEQYKQQLEANNYPSSTQYSHNLNIGSSNILYSNNNDKQKNKQYREGLGQNLYSQSNQQSDLITLSPYYYSNLRENSQETKTKQPFDHDKALKNIVPIDVSNVVSNSDNQVRLSSHFDSNNRYSLSNYAKDQTEQNIKQYYKPLTDSYYKDKNAIYGFNIKTKPEDSSLSDRVKQIENSVQIQGKPHQAESFYNHGNYNDNKRFIDDTSQSHYMSQLNNYHDSLQSSANVQQQGLTRPINHVTSDLSSILKLNDIPFRLTQGLSADSLRLHNSNFDQSGIPTPLPVRLNQNVDNHQIDVATNILNKLMSNKPTSLSIGRPEGDTQTGNLLSTVNGFKIANPYNMDLKLVADMLKGKPAIDESNISPLRDQFNKPVPLKLDISQLQQLLLKNDANLGFINNGLSSLSNPYFEVYNPPGYYQGVKYSRSQEEEENIPIADASSNHPIGAVIEEDEPVNGQEVNSGLDTTGVDDESVGVALTEERPKNSYSSSFRSFVERHRHPNSLLSGRHSVQRKHPKSEINEPYPLLKPPPRASRNRSYHSNAEKTNRRRRVNKPKVLRIFKTEPLFESESSVEEEDKSSVATLLKPPPVAEEKSDITNDMTGA